MKRWFSHLFIGLYLSALSVGIVSHTLKFGSASHPIMYFFVWDMFCGWSSHEIRYHIIAEGESGTYYELTPAPWLRFMPYGDVERTHYDVLGNAHHKMALNALKHTDHEPILRIVKLEEDWPKKYNLSDQMWSLRFDEPKDPMSYYWQRWEMTAEGQVISSVEDEYCQYLQRRSVADNPRLVQDATRRKEHFIVNPIHRANYTSDE